MAAGCALSKRVLKSWRAVEYCGLPGRTNVPCKLLARADQSALVGGGKGVFVGVGRLVGIGVAFPTPDGPLWQASSSPDDIAPTTQSVRNSLRLSPPAGTAASGWLRSRFIETKESFPRFTMRCMKAQHQAYTIRTQKTTLARLNPFYSRQRLQWTSATECLCLYLPLHLCQHILKNRDRLILFLY